MLDENAELKRYIAARGQCKGTITKICNFMADEAKPRSLQVLKVKKDLLIKAFSEYKEYNIDILALVPSDNENFDEFEDKYCATLSQINECIALTSGAGGDAGSGGYNGGSGSKFQRLPRINIKTFSGDLSEFHPFMNLFISVVDKNTSLSDCDKLYYLTTFLSGEALDVVKHLPLTSENYIVGLNLLKDRYDHKLKIITHHVNAILDIEVLKKANSVSLRAVVSQVKQHLCALKGLGQPTEHWDAILVCILQRKLDFYIVRSYYEERENKREMPKLDCLLSFIENRAIALETASPHQVPTWGKSGRYSLVCNAAKSEKASASPPTNIKCKFCKSNIHRLYACKKFKLAPTNDRCAFVNKNNYCKICLNEHSDECKFKFKCTVCKKDHNTLLHVDETKSSSNNIPSDPPQVSLFCKRPAESLLPTVQVRVRTRNDRELVVRALLDSGSQVCLVRSDLIDKLDVQVYEEKGKILGICEGLNKINKRANFTISSCIKNYQVDIDCCIVETITGNLPQFQICKEKLNLKDIVQLADRQFDRPGQIDILLGCNIFFQALLHQATPIEESGPYLISTQFGEVIAGSLPKECVRPPRFSTSTAVCNQACHSVNDLDKNITSFWQAEKVPEVFPETTSEQEQAECIFQQSVILKDNRFQVALPLKQPIGALQLGDSFSAALQRFNNLERRLSKDTKLYQMYREFINEYIALGHGEFYDISNYDLDNDAVFFLPHHPVFNENSQTTKMRTVFDGSLKTKHRLSLNDVLLNGPIVQNELFDILVLFRLPKYILIADIKQMFRQILVDPQYRSLQNILWRNSKDDPIGCIQLKTVTYGLKSSSYLATRCLLELAERFKDQYSLASSVLRYNTYIDDIQAGHDDIEILMETKRQLLELLSLGGFQLHKWGSNDPRLLNDIPSEKKCVNDIDLSKDDAFIKTLGLRYNISSDNFCISCPEKEVKQNYTKRQVLSFISKIFDPLGLVGPIVVSAKLIMQQVYQLKSLWDDELPKELNDQWKCFATGLIEMSSIQTKRHIHIHGARRVELIGFADASNKAYGCCLYLRVIQVNGSVEVSLICSKSRANSINNELTTPRKELNSALLLSMLSNKVYNTLSLQCKNKINVYLYLDSKIVLAWLDTEPIKLLSYVANRVIKIKDLTADWRWFYVKTTENPADLISRGVEPRNLQSNVLWWSGPQFLNNANFVHNDEKEMLLDSQELPELKKIVNTCNLTKRSTDETVFFSHFSDINKLKRLVAYLFRFVHNSNPKNKDCRSLDVLQPAELDNALLKIIKCDQLNCYAAEISCIKQGKQVKGSLSSLNPFIDGEDLLRVGGRLDNSQLPYAQKHPIILAKGSHITKLIIWNEHENLFHAGPKLLLSSLNQRFWLINAIREIKCVIHKCLKCFRLKAKTASQLMGSLPSDRVQAARPFEKVGIDYAGPFNIKFARVRKPVVVKAYVLIFVCFVTKAIHVELASDLKTETFLNCFKRFIARRNKPSQVFCDNASTFKCASSQLHNLYDLQSSSAHQSAVKSFSSTQGITFNFIPAYSPVFAGLWEAGVKSLKYHLKRVVGSSVLTYEEFNTIIIQIEGILNSRPLTCMSSDPSDMTYLTPGHFLTGAPITSFPEQDLTDMPTNRLHFWRQCTQIQQNFFKQWSRQYLNMLQNRPKWKNEAPNIKIGTLVILRDKNITPFNWPMARVVKLYPGNDGKVRAFDVKTPTGHILRTSITKICVLPIND